MTFTGGVYALGAVLILYGIRWRFYADYRRAQDS
jgi:hypothetical protein